MSPQTDPFWGGHTCWGPAEQLCPSCKAQPSPAPKTPPKSTFPVSPSAAWLHPWGRGGEAISNPRHSPFGTKPAESFCLKIKAQIRIFPFEDPKTFCFWLFQNGISFCLYKRWGFFNFLNLKSAELLTVERFK